MHKAIIGLISLCVASKLLLAQDNAYLFKKTHYGLSFKTMHVFKGKSNLHTGTQNMKPHGQLGFDGGLEFVFNPEENIGIKTGLHFGAIPFDWCMNLSDSLNGLWQNNVSSLDNAGYVSSAYFGYVAVPLQLVYRKPITQNKYMLFSGGLNFKTFFEPTSLSMAAYAHNDTAYTLFDIDVQNTGSLFQLSFTGAAGIGFATKNKNLWHLFAELEIAPQNFSTGKFIFSTPTGTVSSGTYTKNGSSINIGATYFLTRSKTAAALNSPSAYVYAQDSRHFNKPIDSAALVQLFKRNQLEFNLGLRLNAHTTPITSAGPAPEIKGVTGPAIQFGYTINYHLKHALKIEAAFSSINYKYDNIYFYDSLNMKPEFFSFEYAQTYVGLGVNYLYRYPISRSILWFGESGMQVQFLTEGKHNSQIAYRIYSLDENCLINRSVTKTMVPAAKFGTGLLFATRNYNMWRIGLAYQHAFNKPISEDYFFQNTSTIRQQGSTKINASGFTATIGYIYSIAPSPYAIAKHRLKNK